MLKNEVIEFLGKIDAYTTENHGAELAQEKFQLKIIGKSALLLAGLRDSVGTVDIDSLRIDGKAPTDVHAKIAAGLIAEYGRSNLHSAV